jgi:hypothetical protein
VLVLLLLPAAPVVLRLLNLYQVLRVVIKTM